MRCLALLLAAGTAALQDPPAGGGDPCVGLGVIASGIGNDYSADHLAAFVEAGRFRHVVIDWAWITAHWPRSRFDRIEAVAKRCKALGIPVSAMYRPRFFAHEQDRIRVPVQVGPDGRPFGDKREICFSHPEARAWGVQWAVDILKKCPSFEEVTIYNPRFDCHCGKCIEGRKTDANHAITMTRTFLSEVRAAMRKVRPGAKLGAVYPAVASWYAAMKDAIDVARPYVYITEAADFERDMAAAQAVLRAAPSAGACLAKLTWGPADKVTDERLAKFVTLARVKKLPWFVWTFETAFLEGTYDLDSLFHALNLDPRRMKPLALKLGAKKK